MAFAMSLPRTKRLKYIDEEGLETFVDNDKWNFLRAADPLFPDPLDGAEGEEKEDANSKAAAPSPWEAIEKLQNARGEVEVMLDLVAAVESGLHMATTNVPPRKSTLQGLTCARALAVHAKENQLRQAAARLADAHVVLAARVARQDGFLAEAAALHRPWMLQRPPPGSHAHFVVDVSLPFAPGPPEPGTDLFDIMPDAAGHLRVVGAGTLKNGGAAPRGDGAARGGQATPPGFDVRADKAQQPAAEEASAVYAAASNAWVQRADLQLLAAQEAVLWSALQTALLAEAQALGPAAQSFAARVVPLARCSSDPSVRALDPLLRHLFIANAKGVHSGKQPTLLAQVADLLRHAAFRAHVRSSLHVQVVARGKDAAVALQYVPVDGRACSALEIQPLAADCDPVLLLMTGETAQAEGLGLGTAQAESQAANSSALRDLARPDISQLLATLALP